jgi:GTP-binding protein HflX
MNDLISTEKELEKVVLVAIRTPDVSEREVEEYLDELAFLAETAGAIPVKRFVQSLLMMN